MMKMHHEAKLDRTGASVGKLLYEFALNKKREKNSGLREILGLEHVSTFNI